MGGDSCRHQGMPINLFMYVASGVREAVSLSVWDPSTAEVLLTAGTDGKHVKSKFFSWKQLVGRPLCEGTRSIGVQDVPVLALCARTVCGSSAKR